MKPNFITKQSVQYRVWDQNQCAEVVNATFRVLERTGCLVQNEKARELMKEAGCLIDGDRVRIPASLMEWAVNSAPSQLTFYNQSGQPAAKLAPYEVNFGPTMGDTFILDSETGQKRRGLKSDCAKAAMVCDALPNVTYASGLTLVSDCNPDLAEVYEIRHALPNTTKPMMCWSHSLENFASVVEMFEAVAGGSQKLAERPRALCLICPVDPLIHTDNGLSQVMYAAEKRFPVVYIAGISFGCVGPVTAAGTIAVGMADTLVGLLVSQLTRKGAPFVASKFCDNMNMRTGNVTHSRPELHLANSASADVFRYLKLPFALNTLGTDASCINQQYIFDAATNCYDAWLCGSNWNWGMGVLEGGNSSCLEGLVFYDEAIGFTSRLTEGIEVSPYTLAEDIIDRVGPGGNFFAEEQTAKHVRSFWEPYALASQSHDQWIAGGKKDVDSFVKEKVKEILAKGPQTSLSDDVLNELDAIVARAEKRIAK
ncbi:trimethylamine methyltransferase family protein [Sporomusa sp.]|uniref:trimethylamine methyltransferase family protein n=1 Tax=Sporomusa sp. TaxID=2078658 RepID=UPI002C08C38A|nr:trimethylamine methyltransferase family protein [Sporomusa sp.]HWR09942.1 trimethylamine methyltransferase family protein [Sporomusa sp.]